MDIHDIIHMPTTVNNVHQSCYRDSSLMDYIVDLLRKGTPGEVVLDIIVQIRGCQGKAIDLEQGKDTIYDLVKAPDTLKS